MKHRLTTFICLLLLSCVSSFAQKTIQLQGSWEYVIGDSAKYSDFVMLPGSVQSTDKVWYKRGVYVPRDWQHRRITLFFERLYAEAVVYINGKRVGQDTLRFAPHQYDVSQFIVPGQRNTIAVSVAKHDRNGIFGRMELREHSQDLYLRQIKFQPHPYDGILHIDMTVAGQGLRYEDFFVEVIAQREDKDSADIIRGIYKLKRHTEFDLHLGHEVALWGEFHPHLYRVGVFLGDDYYESSIGMCEFSVKDSQLVFNRRPLHLRGVVVDDPLIVSGSALSDEQAWLDLLTKYKERGFNLLRFRSYCPLEAAFAMADKLGLFLLPGDSFSEEETKRMTDAYGHHPSFVMKEDLLVDSRVH